jgi:uncharacterized protein YecE (DUF72 family)
VYAVGTIRIGLAGWDYPDWKGIVYPARSPGGFDRLAYVSGFVDAIEINSSFYRPVPPERAESWVRRTEGRANFRFTAKVHRSWTHEPGSDLDQVVPPTLSGLRPLLDAGRLGGLLIQFPQSFHHGTESVDRLSRLVERAAGWPVAVEVRHRSWESDEAEWWFADSGVGWCLVDQPRAGGATARPLPRVTGKLAYMRLHGRNEGNWFREGAGRDARYDYLYPREELVDLADQARRMAAEAEALYVIQNNHFRGQALVNTLQLGHMLHGDKPLAPDALVDAYPGLIDDVCVKRPRLF